MLKDKSLTPATLLSASSHRLSLSLRDRLVLQANLIQNSTAIPTNLLLPIKNLKQALPHLARLLARINGLPDARLLVVRHDGGGLAVVSGEALLEGLGVVVGALYQGLAGDVVLHVALGRVEDLVVRAAGGGVHEAAGDARDEEVVVDLQLDGVLEGLLRRREHLVELFGLGDGAGEAVQDEAVGVLESSLCVSGGVPGGKLLHTRSCTRRCCPARS